MNNSLPCLGENISCTRTLMRAWMISMEGPNLNNSTICHYSFIEKWITLENFVSWQRIYFHQNEGPRLVGVTWDQLSYGLPSPTFKREMKEFLEGSINPCFVSINFPSLMQWCDMCSGPTWSPSLTPPRYMHLYLLKIYKYSNS